MEEDKPSTEENPNNNKGDDTAKMKDSNDLRLFAVIAVLILIVISVSFLIWGFSSGKDDNANDGFVPYGVYKFRAHNDLYSLEYQWQNTIFDINFRYHPNNVTDIPIRGPWNDLGRDVYIAFDPYMSERSMAYTRAASLDLVQKLSLVFGRNVQIVCTDNTHPDCDGLAEVTCETHDSAIIFYEDDTPRITLKGSCYEIHGFEEDLFRAEHKLVYVMLNIIRE